MSWNKSVSGPSEKVLSNIEGDPHLPDAPKAAIVAVLGQLPGRVVIVESNGHIVPAPTIPEHACETCTISIRTIRFVD